MKKRDLFPMNEMEKSFFFSNQCKILEIQKCYSMVLMYNFDLLYLKLFALAHKLILESVLKLKKCHLLHYKTF